MVRTFLVGERDRRRDEVEHFIRETYRVQFGAVLGGFPPILIAHFNDDGNVLCAAGLRSHQDGFFSECYLDGPVESVLTEVAGSGVGREEIFEVSTLASRQPRAIGHFIFEIVSFGDIYDYRWSFFTLTRRLRRMVEYFGVGPTLLADADPARVPNPADWGSYYSHQPGVFATQRSQLSAAILDFIQEENHAVAI